MGPYGKQNFKKRYFSHSFHPISAKLYDKQVGHRRYRLLLFLSFFLLFFFFLTMCQKLLKLWHFEMCLNKGLYGAANFKTLLLPQFNQMWSKLYKDIAYHG